MTPARQRRRAELRRRRVRRRGLVGAAVALAALAAVFTVRVLMADGETGVDRTGSERVAGDPVAITRVPASYRVEYRVTDLVDRPARTTTEVLSVRRPFDARVDTYEGAGRDGEMVSEQITTFGLLSTGTSGADPVVLAVDPTPAPADVRVDAVLGAALERERIERRERRVVARRPCSVLRTRDPLTAGPVAPATEVDFVDTCVDAAGLVLEEVVHAGGEALRRKLAVEIQENPTFADDLFTVGEPSLTPADGGGSVTELAPGSLPPGRVYDGGVPPPEFGYRGRYAVIPAQPGVVGDPAADATRRASVADVFVRGPDVVIVDRGATLMGGPFYAPDPDAPDVEAGMFDEVDLFLDAGAVELRALPDQASWVRVMGTLPPAELERVLGSVRQVEGNTVRYR